MIEIDFNSDEAIYLQLKNQIILGIATSRFQEGDSLPSVRQLAEVVGINITQWCKKEDCWKLLKHRYKNNLI